MTTPNQSSPDGAVTVGGGQFNYGQLVDENTLKADFIFEPPTDLASALDLLPHVLGLLPDSAMAPWQKWLGMSDSQLVNGEVQGALSESMIRNQFQVLMDDITSTLFGGGSFTMTTNDDVLLALTKTFNTLQEHAKAFFGLSIRTDGSVARAETYTVDFAEVPSMAASGFDVEYSGAGASTVEVVNGVAQWQIVDRLPRDAKIIYEASTASDFQSVRGTLASPPSPASSNGEKPYFYALARVSPDKRSYVWARAYSEGLGVYKADAGCTVDGVETVWETGIPLTWNLNMRFDAGVGTEEREFQVWSGTKVAFSFSEPGDVSRLCDAGHASGADHTETCVKYRGWGAIAQVRDQRDAARVAAAGVVDNPPAAVVGSTARMVRLSDTAANLEGGDVVAALPTSFFDSVPFESKDIDARPIDGVFVVGKANTYVVSARVELNPAVASVCHLLLQISYDEGTTWQTVQYGASAASEPMFGSWVQAVPAGAALRLAYKHSGFTIAALNGGSAGAKTFFSIAGIG